MKAGEVSVMLFFKQEHFPLVNDFLRFRKCEPAGIHQDGDQSRVVLIGTATDILTTAAVLAEMLAKPPEELARTMYLVNEVNRARPGN